MGIPGMKWVAVAALLVALTAGIAPAGSPADVARDQVADGLREFRRLAKLEHRDLRESVREVLIRVQGGSTLPADAFGEIAASTSTLLAGLHDRSTATTETFEREVNESTGKNRPDRTRLVTPLRIGAGGGGAGRLRSGLEKEYGRQADRVRRLLRDAVAALAANGYLTVFRILPPRIRYAHAVLPGDQAPDPAAGAHLLLIAAGGPADDGKDGRVFAAAAGDAGVESVRFSLAGLGNGRSASGLDLGPESCRRFERGTCLWEAVFSEADYRGPAEPHILPGLPQGGNVRVLLEAKSKLALLDRSEERIGIPRSPDDRAGAPRFRPTNRRTAVRAVLTDLATSPPEEEKGTKQHRFQVTVGFGGVYTIETLGGLDLAIWVVDEEEEKRPLAFDDDGGDGKNARVTLTLAGGMKVGFLVSSWGDLEQTYRVLVRRTGN